MRIIAGLALFLSLLSGCGRTDGFIEVSLSDFDAYRELPGHTLAEPENGFVPDAETAVRIAEAVLEATYGADVLDIQRPLRIALRGDIWVVFGTLPEDFAGGVPHIDISRADGHVLRVSHGY